jgi:hypothetical protein
MTDPDAPPEPAPDDATERAELIADLLGGLAEDDALLAEALAEPAADA